MIYDCPQCGMPQEAGMTFCPHCRAQFDGPVPDDAILPQDFVAPAATLEAASPEALVSEAYISEAHTPEARVYDVPHLDAPDLGTSTAEAAPATDKGTPAAAGADPTIATEVKPPPAVGDQPYLTPPSYSPPPYIPPSYAPPPTPQRSPLGGLTRALLIAFPIVLILVLGGVYFANSLNSGADTSEAPLPVQPARSSALPPAPVGTPVTFSGGSNTNVPDNDPQTHRLVGRWQAKSGEEYEFSADGTGTHKGPGPAGTSPSSEQSFTWGAAQNRVMLYMSKDETLRFNAGPDDGTIFLASQTGRYVQYARVKNS